MWDMSEHKHSHIFKQSQLDYVQSVRSRWNSSQLLSFPSIGISTAEDWITSITSSDQEISQSLGRKL